MQLLKTIFEFVQDLYNPRVYGKKPVTRITQVKPLGGYRLALAFSNGEQGVVDIAEHVPLTGILAPLADPVFLAQAYVDRGMLRWPGDLDMDSTVLHALAMKRPIELVKPLKVEA